MCVTETNIAYTRVQNSQKKIEIRFLDVGRKNLQMTEKVLLLVRKETSKSIWFW